jgi:FSR family fosmidomycin resistance protein-like MFS transporter
LTTSPSGQEHTGHGAFPPGAEPPARTQAKKFRKGRVLGLAWGHFAHDVFSSFYPPLLPLLRESLGLSFTQAGGLTVIQRLPSLANPLLGWFADRASLRWLVVAGPTITATAMTSIGWAPDKLSLALMLLLAGIGAAFYHVPSPVLLARAAGRRIGFGMSLFMVAGEAARSVGPILVLGAVALWGLKGLPTLIPLGVATSLLLWLVTRHPRPRGGAAAEAEDPGAPPESREPWAPLLRLLATIAVIIAGRSFVVAALMTYLPAFVTARGGSLWLGGSALAILEAAGAAGALTSGTLSDRLGRRRILLVVTMTCPLAMGALVVSPIAMMIPALIVLGALSFSTNPVLLALVQDRAGGRPAVANGLFMTLNFGIRSAVVLLIGVMADAWSLQRAFALCAALSLLAVPGAVGIPRDGTRSDRHH